MPMIPADNTTVTFRAAKSEDAADIVRVLRSSRLRFLPYAPPAHTEAEDRNWATETLIPSGGVTVAMRGDSLIGVLAVSSDEQAGWIDQLYIQPEYCGQGIGTRLLEQALASLSRPIRLYTFQQNEGARRFYAAHGFTAVAFGDGSDNEEQCPDVLYELSCRD